MCTELHWLVPYRTSNWHLQFVFLGTYIGISYHTKQTALLYCTHTSAAPSLWSISTQEVGGGGNEGHLSCLSICPTHNFSAWWDMGLPWCTNLASCPGPQVACCCFCTANSREVGPGPGTRPSPWLTTDNVVQHCFQTLCNSTCTLTSCLV